MTPNDQLDAGLKSANKRVRVPEKVDSEEEPEATFGLASDVANEGDVDENVESEPQLEHSSEASKISFGPAKKVAKRGEALKNVKTVNSRTMDQGPDWYESVNPKQAYLRADMQNPKYLYTLVNNVKKVVPDNNNVALAFESVRHRLQQMEFYHSLCLYTLVNNAKKAVADNNNVALAFENFRQRLQQIEFYHSLYLYTLVNNAKKAVTDNNNVALAFESVRQRLQQMEFHHSLSPILVKKFGLLDD